MLDDSNGELLLLVEAILASLIAELKVLLLLELILHFEFVHVHLNLILGSVVGGKVLLLGLVLFIHIYQLWCLSCWVIIP